MSENILRRDRVNTETDRNKRRITRLVDERISESVETVESGTAKVVYGYAGIRAMPVFQKARNSSRITTGISTVKYSGDDSGHINRALFGEWFRLSHSGTQELLMRQYVICAGSIRNPLSLFIDNESIRLDGWAAKTFTALNKWRNSAHHFNVGADIGATKLASVYFPADRTLSDTAEGLSLVTGLYEKSSNFKDSLPEIYVIVEGQWPAKRITSSGALESYTDGKAVNHGLYSALIDWLSSDDYGAGFDASDFDAESWSRTTRGGIALTQNAIQAGLTTRIRQPAYDADTANPKNEYSTIGSPVPVLAEWPIWGAIDTNMDYFGILQEFTAACPPLLLWLSLSGKLKADVTELSSLTSVTADALIDDDDLIEVPGIAVPAIANSHGNVAVKFQDYEEDFRSNIYDATTVLASVTRTNPGTYSFTVPAGVTKINVTVRGANGGRGGAADSNIYNQGSRKGGDGGTGETPGTDGGNAGLGGENRTGTGYTGDRIPNNGTTGRNCYFQQGSLPVTWGSMTDIEASGLTDAQIKARRGTGGGGGGGYSYYENCSDYRGNLSWAGGGGGGGGGSSAIKRGADILLEAYGGRGGGGSGQGGTWPQPGLEGEAGADLSITLTVTPGEILTIVVGQGGGNSYGEPNSNLPGVDPRTIAGYAANGQVSIVSVNDDAESDNISTATVRAALCGSKQHAQRISREKALRSQLHRVSLRLKRKWLGTEPGDILKLTGSYPASLIVIERGIARDLSVDVLGLKLPFVAQDPSL